MGAAIVSSDRTLASGLAQRLADLGTPSVTVDSSESARALEQALTIAASRLGETPAVIRLAVSPAAARRDDLATLELADWVARTEAPLRELLAFHQAAQRFLTSRRGGRVLAVVPTAGLAGSPGLVPMATLGEADRSMLKAQARVCGRLGITLNTVAVTTSLLADSHDDLDRGGLPSLALAAPGLAEVAAVVAGLLGPAFAAVTGQTIAVDGGCWMAL